MLVGVRVQAAQVHEEDVAIGAHRPTPVDHLGHLHKLLSERRLVQLSRVEEGLRDVGVVEDRLQLAIHDERRADLRRDRLAEDARGARTRQVDDRLGVLVVEHELGDLPVGLQHVGQHAVALEDLLVALDRVRANREGRLARAAAAVALRERLGDPTEHAVGVEFLGVHVVRTGLLRVVREELMRLRQPVPVALGDRLHERADAGDEGEVVLLVELMEEGQLRVQPPGVARLRARRHVERVQRRLGQRDAATDGFVVVAQIDGRARVAAAVRHEEVVRVQAAAQEEDDDRLVLLAGVAAALVGGRLPRLVHQGADEVGRVELGRREDEPLHVLERLAEVVGPVERALPLLGQQRVRVVAQPAGRQQQAELGDDVGG